MEEIPCPLLESKRGYLYNCPRESLCTNKSSANSNYTNDFFGNHSEAELEAEAIRIVDAIVDETLGEFDDLLANILP